MPATPAPHTRTATAARGAVYGLLARALAYPEPHHREVIAGVAADLIAMPEAIRAAAAALAASMVPAADMEAAFTRLFTHSSSRDCPPYETAYTATDVFQQAQQLADIAGFYTAFGVMSAPGGERLDHVSAELEFMQFLTAKEGYAREHLGAARVQQCRRTERLFLRDHLACWGPGFGRRLAALDPGGWHGRAGRLLVAWLEHECHTLGAVPAAVIDRPLPAWPEPDTGECGLDEDGLPGTGPDPCAGCALGGPLPSTPSPEREGEHGFGTIAVRSFPFPSGKGAGGLGLPVLER